MYTANNKPQWKQPHKAIITEIGLTGLVQTEARSLYSGVTSPQIIIWETLI